MDLLVEREGAGGVSGKGSAVLGESHAATVGLEEGHTRLAFELGELLGDCRRAVRQRFCDGRERAPEGEFVQEPEASELERAVLPISR